MKYYQSNALYEHILAKRLPQFRFVAGNAWQLVYGDNSCRPLLLVFAVGVPDAQLDHPPARAERDDFFLLDAAGALAGLPVLYVRFPCDVAAVETVRVSDESFRYQTYTMPELARLYAAFGVPVSDTRTTKYLNDRTSSAYHNWQRKSLGAALTVSDIDLWRVTEAGKPVTVFELKRSYYELSKWQPFPDDYRNFRLLSGLCNSAGMQFRIIYNQRVKSPFQDKIDRLKLFSVDFSKTAPVSEEGILTLNEFDNL